MDDKEDIMNALEEFSRHPSNKIPDILERYFQRVALTGETLFEWEKLKPAFRCKMDQSMKEFYEQVPTDHLHALPNVEVVKFEEMRTRLLNVLDSFTGAPFTIQRLCELILHPQKQYKRPDKFMRGIEKDLVRGLFSERMLCDLVSKYSNHMAHVFWGSAVFTTKYLQNLGLNNLMIVSAVDPFGNKIVSEPKPFINGLDSNGMDSTEMHTPEKKGSPCLPPPPTNSPAGTLWFNSVTPTNSPVTTGSPWHRTGSADGSNSSVTSSPAFTLQSSSFGENWPDAELDDYAQSPPEKKSRLSAGTTDSVPSSSNVEPSQSSGDCSGDMTGTDKSDVSGSDSGVSSAAPAVSSASKMSVDSAEEPVASSCPTTSTSGSFVTAVSSSSVAAVTSSECAQVSESLPLSSRVTDSTSATECHMTPTSTDHVQGTDSENVLSPPVTTVQSLLASELSKLASNSECLPTQRRAGTHETSEAASTDSDSTSSGSDSNSSADSQVMKAEVSGSAESVEVKHTGTFSQLADTNVRASTSEDTITKSDSEESQGFDFAAELGDPAPSCNSEVSSSSESRSTEDNNTTSTQSPVHSTGISAEIHSSEQTPIVSQSQQLTNEAGHTDTTSSCYPVSNTGDSILASTSSSDEVCKESVPEECHQSSAQNSGNISVVPSSDDPPEPMSTNSAQDDVTDTAAASSTSQGEGDSPSGQNPEHEPMDTD